METFTCSCNLYYLTQPKLRKKKKKKIQFPPFLCIYFMFLKCLYHVQTFKLQLLH